MENTTTVRRMFDAYLAGDAETARRLLADDYSFTSPQDDHIDKAAFMERCFPTAERVVEQHIVELAPAGPDGVFVMYEYELKTGERHRNTEYTVVRDGKLVETHVFFGGRYDGPRVDRADRLIDAPPEDVYAALVDPVALAAWLPPAGMRATFERFDPTPDGSYRLVLTYDDAAGSPGKATADSDVVEGRFVDLVPGRRVVQEVEFTSDDPSFAGTMTMTWQVTADGDGTRVEFIAEDVPPGISAEDHAAGLASSLANLAALVENEGAT